VDEYSHPRPEVLGRPTTPNGYITPTHIRRRLHIYRWYSSFYCQVFWTNQ